MISKTRKPCHRRLAWVFAVAVIVAFASPAWAVRGDANDDGEITLADAIYVSQYIFARGAAPLPTLDSGDANCDGRIEPLDVVVIVNYVMRAGKRPACPAE